MKRALVDEYASESDSDNEATPEQATVVVTFKKRKTLPALSSNFVPPTPVDDPSLHQGRVRTTPFVAGQYCAHVYIPVRLSKSLKDVLSALLSRATDLCPTLHSLIGHPPSPDDGSPADQHPPYAEELHISLSRPVYLRAHQRVAFRAAVKDVASRHGGFDVSFATLAELQNDERTRAFLVCEVGAGFAELQALAGSLEPHFQGIKQATYYASPRFHASIGWALLSNPAFPADPAFPTIEHFPSDFVQTLRQEFGEKIREAVTVEEVRVRVGKEEISYRLG